MKKVMLLIALAVVFVTAIAAEVNAKPLDTPTGAGIRRQHPVNVVTDYSPVGFYEGRKLAKS